MVKFIYFLTFCMVIVASLIAAILIVNAFKTIGVLGGLFALLFTLLVVTNIVIAIVED